MYTYDMPYKVRSELCRLLDNIDCAWKQLAGCYGYSVLEVCELEKELYRPGGSPTDKLLDRLSLRNVTVDELAYKLKSAALMRAVQVLAPLIDQDLYDSLMEIPATKETHIALPTPSQNKKLQTNKKYIDLDDDLKAMVEMEASLFGDLETSTPFSTAQRTTTTPQPFSTTPFPPTTTIPSPSSATTATVASGDSLKSSHLQQLTSHQLKQLLTDSDYSQEDARRFARLEELTQDDEEED